MATVGLWRFDFIGRMMRGYGYAFAARPGYFSPFMSFAGILGILFGLIVIASAIMLSKRPTQHSTWGILILIF
jgi:tryptophan-rich sensory protein